MTVADWSSEQGRPWQLYFQQGGKKSIISGLISLFFFFIFPTLVFHLRSRSGSSL